MTPQIATVLIIIALMSISFFTELLPLGFTALMVPVLLEGTGILKTSEAWAGFANQTVITWIGLFIVGAVFAKTSFTYRIKVFIKKNTNGDPLKVILIILAACTLMGIMTTATATLAAVTPILEEICRDNRMSQKKVFKAVGDVGTWAAVQCFPIGGSLSYLLLFNSYLEQSGTDLRFGLLDFTWIKLPMWFVLIAYYVWINRKIDESVPVSESKTLGEELQEDPSKMTSYTPAQEKAAAAIFVLNIVCMVIASATRIVPIHLISIAFASLAVGLKLISQNEALHSVSWSVIFLVAGTLPLSTAIKNSGTGEWVTNLMIQAFPSLTNPVILASIFCIITMIVTQFMSNAAVIAMFAPIGATLAINLDMDPRLVVAGVSCGALICFGTPMAGTAGGYAYGICNFNMKEFIKIGWIPCVLMTIAFIIWGPIVLEMIY